MSIPIVSTYTYAYDLETNETTYVQGSDVVDRGDWMVSGSYVIGNVITYSGALYYCIAPNTGLPPTDNIDDHWTTLVQVDGTIAPTSVYIRDDYRTVYAHHLNTGTGADQIDASDIPYQNGTYTTVSAALDALFYTAISITSFTNDQTVIETGGSAVDVTLTWALNKSPTTQSLNQGIGTLSTSARTYTQSGSFTTSRTYTLTASDGTTTTNGNSSVTFMQKRYWGTNANTSLNDAEILALSSEFSSSRSQSRTIIAAGAYVYFAWPASYGTGTFTVNGLPNTAWTLVTRAFVNASGYSESYNIYRSDNLLTGTYTIVVS